MSMSRPLPRGRWRRSPLGLMCGPVPWLNWTFQLTPRSSFSRSSPGAFKRARCVHFVVQKCSTSSDLVSNMSGDQQPFVWDHRRCGTRSLCATYWRDASRRLSERGWASRRTSPSSGCGGRSLDVTQMKRSDLAAAACACYAAALKNSNRCAKRSRSGRSFDREGKCSSPR